MAELKTKVNDQDVNRFLEQLSDPQQRQDCLTLSELMREATGAAARMWGDNIIGFGTYRYQYASGRAGEWFLTGFAPRKQNLTLYIMSGFENYDALLQQLGKHKIGKACLYIKRLSEVDQAVLRELISQSVQHMLRSNNMEATTG